MSNLLEQNDIDPIMPFSVEFDKRKLPPGLTSTKNPIIFFGSQAKGFYGNIRYAKARTTRIFFFEISLSNNETNFPFYYTIIVVIPGSFTKDPSMPNYEKVFETIKICTAFEKGNKNFLGECKEEATRFSNLAIQHVNSHNPTPGAWGNEVRNGEPIMMAVVLGQYDFGFDSEMMSSFSIGKIDFNPPKKGGKKIKSNKKRSNKRKSRKIKSMKRK